MDPSLSSAGPAVLQDVSVSSGGLKGGLGGVVPPDPGLAVLLFQFQNPEFLLPALLAVPQLLTLVHAQTRGPHHLQVFVAPQRGLPRVPEARHRTARLAQEPRESSSSRAGPGQARGGGGVTVVLQVVRGVETMVGDDVKAIPGQNQAVGVLVAGAGVEASVGQVQALNQQPSLQGQEPVFRVLRKLRDEMFRRSISAQSLKSNKIFSTFHTNSGKFTVQGWSHQVSEAPPT